MMTRTLGAQARALRRTLFGRMAIQIAVFSLVLLAAAVILDAFVLDGVGSWMADQTSTWFLVSPDEASPYLEDGDFQVLWSEADNAYQVRYIGLYNTLRTLKVPAAIVVYLVGLLVIVFLSVNRSLRYFDELANAVAGVIAQGEKPVELSDDLAIVRGELNAVREASLANERAAVAAERRKNELVTYLAHDIKTPLTSVLGYLSLLGESDELPEKTRDKYTSVALAKAERLESLIDEFFEITRYNLQSIPIERSTVDVRLFCEQVAEEFYPAASARGISVEVTAPENETFFIDPDKLARALGNVLRNAVAYADEDTAISFDARRNESTGGWLLVVANQGREISEAHLQSIFEKFYREDGARSTQKGGAGLGLAIAKEIILAHGGGIRAESRDGVTTFTVALR